MSAPSNNENAQERSMVDIAYDFLQDQGESMAFQEIVKHVGEQKGFSTSDIDMVAHLYTEINIDGRFVCVGRNLWGLKHWFPVEQSSDSAVAANVKEDEGLLEDEDEYEELEETEEEDYPVDLLLDDQEHED